MKGERRDVKNFLPEFYSKEVASNASSALPRNCRRTILNLSDCYESFPGKTLLIMLTR